MVTATVVPPVPVEVAPDKPVMPWQENYELRPTQALVTGEGEKDVNVSKSTGMPWEGKYTEKPIKKVEGLFASGMPKGNTSSYIDQMIGAESGGRADAKNPNSSATGPAQFTDDTWRMAVKEAGKTYSMEDRKDPVKAREIATDFTERNRKRAVKDLGHEPSNVELYMYHFLGRDGGGEFLNAPRDKPATDFVSKGAASANKTVFYKGGTPRTVGEVIDNFARKF